MKLTAIIILTACLQVSAGGRAQDISLKAKNVPLEKVVSQIEKQTHYLFWYDRALLKGAKRVNIEVDHADIQQVLSILLKNQPFTFSIVENLVALKRKDPNSHFAVQLNTDPLPIDIKGRVINQNGEPVAASVLVKGSRQGTNTNADGMFELKNVSADATVLIISSIGYKTQEVSIGESTNLNIVLVAEDIRMDSVVVVGYGTQMKANVTGAISSITSEDIKSVSTSNLVTGLAGKLPGVRILQRTGEPGMFNTLFDIRGYGNPLIVVDGVVMDQSNLVRINPNDIESMSVLKDASAAVYGVQAANGVILVTTKKGDMGKPRVSYSGFYQIQKITNVPEIGNAYSYSTIHVENEINLGASPTSTSFSPEDIQKFKDGTNPSTDWYGLIARNHTTQKNHYVNVSGGSDRIKYFTSFGLMDEVGLWKSGDLNYKKYNVRANITGKITDNMEIELGLDGLVDRKSVV